MSRAAPAGTGADTNSSQQLLLENVTLVVPEQEWSALAAAVLRQYRAAAAAEAGQLEGAAENPQPSTQSAIDGFLAASRVLSFNDDSGVVVLSVARHCGWYGTNITITSVLPEDAPTSADLQQPLQFAAYDALVPDSTNNAQQATQPPAQQATQTPVQQATQPPTQHHPQQPTQRYPQVPTQQQPQPPAQQATQLPTQGGLTAVDPLGQLAESFPDGPLLQPPQAPQPVPPAAPNAFATSTETPRAPPAAAPPQAPPCCQRPAWVVPVAASVSAFVAVALVFAAVALAMPVMRRRNHATTDKPSGVSLPVPLVKCKPGTGDTGGRNPRECPATAAVPAPSAGVSARNATAMAANDSSVTGSNLYDLTPGKAQVAMLCRASASGTAGCSTECPVIAAAAVACEPEPPQPAAQAAAAPSELGVEERLKGFMACMRAAMGTAAASETTSSPRFTAGFDLDTTAASSTPCPSDRRAPTSGTQGTSAGIILEATRYAVARALVRSTTSVDRQPLQSGGEGYADVFAQPPESGLVAVLSVAAESGESNSSTHAAQDRTLFEDFFLRNAMAYYSNLGAEARSATPRRPADGGCAPTDTGGSGDCLTLQAAPSTGLRRKHQQRSVVDAISTVQAELRDAELQVGAVLGSGACGVVYHAVWRGLPVAVKTLVVVSECGARRAAQHRAVMEAAISMSLTHPHVVATYTYDLKPLVQQPSGPHLHTNSTSGSDPPSQTRSVFTPGGSSRSLDECDAFKLYIVQEYCNGGSLKQALDQGVAGGVHFGGLARRLALRLALDVALGMTHIHASRIVHGDLKPANIFLVCGGRLDPVSGKTAPTTTVGASRTAAAEAAGFLLDCQGVPQLTAKVADFGLSLPLAEGATHASHKFQGTPGYTAPEVLSVGRLSPHADVWSFGLMLLELFYGCTLENAQEIRSAMTEQRACGMEQQPLHALLLQDMRNASERSYAAVVMACLSEDPHERPSFDEVAASLSTLYVES